MGLFGSLFGGGSSGGADYHAPEPWKQQAPYLSYGFNQAQDLYNQYKNSPAYQGNLYAPSNPLQQSGLWSLANYGAGQGAQLGQAAGSAALSNLGAGASYGQNAQNLMQQAGQNPTQQIIGNAGSFADNPYMSGMIDATSRDVVRNLNENDLPQLNLDANATGNVDSSRTGVAQGILQRGAADRVGDIAAQLRGGAYSSGLNLAASNYQNQQSNAYNANSQIGNAFTGGVQGAQGAAGLGTGAAQDITQAGAGFQQDEQGMLNQALQQYNMNQQQPWQMLNNYWNVASGNPQSGGQWSAPSNQPNPGIIGTALGVGTSLQGLGAFGSGGWLTGAGGMLGM